MKFNYKASAVLLRLRLRDAAKAHLSHKAGEYRAHLDKDTA